MWFPVRTGTPAQSRNKIMLSSGTQKSTISHKKQQKTNKLHTDFVFYYFSLSGLWHLRQVVFSALTSVDHEAGQPFLPLIYHLLTKGLQIDKKKVINIFRKLNFIFKVARLCPLQIQTEAWLPG